MNGKLSGMMSGTPIRRPLALVLSLALALPQLAMPAAAAAAPATIVVPQGKSAGAPDGNQQMVTLDFNEVDLPTFIKFVSELTHRNFAIDDRVKGKVTIYAPKKIPVSDVYDVFSQVLELKGFGLVPSDNVEQVLPLTDMPPSRDIHVYYLQNANADEMAKVLTGIVSSSVQSAARRPTNIRGRPGVMPGDFEGIVQILADPPTNSLIITASAKDYEMIKAVLEKLDIKRRQVYVEAVILEVTLDTSSNIRTNALLMEDTDPSRYTFFGGAVTSSPGVGLYSTDTTAAAFGSGNNIADAVNGLSGLSFGAVREFTLGGKTYFNVGALIQAVANDANINVLSTPQVLTSDNQKAEIVVGDNVPIITSNSQTTGGNFQTQVERKDVGITLRLTPQILESDLVKLDVFQEISNIRQNPPQGFNVNEQGIITSKKSTTTTVIVQNNQTVVIGGLISDSINDTIKKVPLLGDIPILGWLFKTRGKQTTKTNLLIFLTPHVIKTPAELFALQQAKSRELADFIKEQRIDRKQSRIEFLERAVNPPM